MTTESAKSRLTGLTNLPGTIRWLLSRELAYSEGDKAGDDENPLPAPMKWHGLEHAVVPSLAGLSLEETQFVGFNGRINKLADTCYCYWVGATLHVSEETFHLCARKY